jgi:glutamate-1-semialdehyde 2,1-aminomutase
MKDMVSREGSIDFNDQSIKPIEEYWKKTPKSRRINSEARKSMPGGDTRSVTYYKPYPAYMKKGKGCRLWDLDGNMLLDFCNNYSSQILGHSHPSVVRAVQDTFARGNCYGAPTKEAYQLARILCRRVPSIEKIRFTNSGTEATMQGIRGARAFNGKSKILKTEGGFHGTHDVVQISVKPDLEVAYSAKWPISLAENRGITDNIVKDVLVTRFNDKDLTAKIVKKNKDDIAAIIIEPVMVAAGIIPPANDFLKFVREITIENDILLIFDEVATFRLSKGGAQEYYGVVPDLTCLGKIIGGGLPVGAFGGREDVMSLFSPRKEKFIKHSGTFNGNAATMAGGIATLKELTRERISKLNYLGGLIRKEIEKCFEDAGIITQLTGVGSLFQFHLTESKVHDYRSAATADKDSGRLLSLQLYNDGIFIASRGYGNLSTEIKEKEVREFINALANSLNETKPYIRKFNPSLLA